jgi:hypothetical protein
MLIKLAASIVLGLLLAATALAQNLGDTSTQVFGVTGKGSSFVYVFDRSLSMEGAPLAAAKRELLASLSHLQRVHQFQIIFYNEKPKMMPVPQMLFADENGVQQAQSFVNTITAAGGTDHVQALQLAMRLRPDVIFLLTDADEPPLTAKQLADVRQNNTAIINVIEFKSPPVGKSPAAPAAKRGSLRQLAAENRGEYKAIDTTVLPAAK